MNLAIQEYIEPFLKSNESLCISLYQPTHKTHPENEQDVIRYKNLLKILDKSLREHYSGREAQKILAPFYALIDDEEFWNHNQQGLAILATHKHFKIIKLPHTVKELAVVADSFHIKPLIRMLQLNERYQILGLNLHEAKLFEGTRDTIEEILIAPEVPHTLTDALGGELTEPHLTVSSYGKGTQGPPMFHGQGGRKDQIDLDAERFFRKVDEGILEYHSRHSKLPLILASLPEYHHLFHRISHNPYLVAESIKYHPDDLSLDELRKEAWKIIKPVLQTKLEELIDKFAELRTKKMGSDKIEEIAKAALAGRVETLFIDADKHIPGEVDHQTGEVKQDNMLDPEIDDLLDDLGEMVLKTQGHVLVIPSDKMPTENGIAAIYRY